MQFKLMFCGFLILIIVLHELAHFAAAIWCKCGVKTMSLGFGKPLVSKHWKGINWEIAPILLGGFCQLQDELVLTGDTASFSNLSFRKKAIISLAGVTVNIVMGAICLLASYHIHSEALWLFGYLSLALGITNALPVAPCLDGGYVVYMPILIKVYGKEKGYKVFESWVKKSFKVVMVLNIISIPFLIWWLIKG